MDFLFSDKLFFKEVLQNPEAIFLYCFQKNSLTFLTFLRKIIIFFVQVDPLSCRSQPEKKIRKGNKKKNKMVPLLFFRAKKFSMTEKDKTVSPLLFWPLDLENSPFLWLRHCLHMYVKGGVRRRPWHLGGIPRLGKTSQPWCFISLM